VVHGRRVGDGCLIGIKAVILGGADIGAGCIVAAGAVVRENAVIPPRSLLAGVPAKVVRAVSDDELATLRGHARHYLELAGAPARAPLSVRPPAWPRAARSRPPRRRPCA
jgi:carbonic anhydrase/acetyltransferase-like protein (isoleucine patch superfamily)